MIRVLVRGGIPMRHATRRASKEALIILAFWTVVFAAALVGQMVDEGCSRPMNSLNSVIAPNGQRDGCSPTSPCFTGPPITFMVLPVELRPSVMAYDLAGQCDAQYRWDFGDGGSSGEPTPRHVYEKPGEYPVIVRVRAADWREELVLSRTVTVGKGVN